MTPCRPPFTITPEILNLVADISLALGKLSMVQRGTRALRLRRITWISILQASLAITESLSTSEKKLEKVSEKTNERCLVRVGPAKVGKWKIVRRNNYV